MRALLEGATAIVSGASRGIGAGIAIELGRHGANVVVNYRESAGSAATVVDEIRRLGGQAIAVQADVEEEVGASRLAEVALDHYGGIDVLVNNAYPGFQGGSIETLSWDIYRSLIEGIMAAAVLPIKSVLPTMRSRGQGSIVNIGTVSLIANTEGQSAYVSGKGALLSLTKVLARDLGPHNIRVNMVSPPPIWTAPDAPPSDDFVRSRLALTPMRRLATAADVGRAVVFFASRLSEFVTGVHMPVSGGETISSA